jgi:hypothetical protein
MMTLRATIEVIVAVALLGATGCEGDQVPPPSEKCKKLAEQCKLPNGPLGVCNSAECKPGETPPCFRCVPQH